MAKKKLDFNKTSPSDEATFTFRVPDKGLKELAKEYLQKPPKETPHAELTVTVTGTGGKPPKRPIIIRLIDHTSATYVEDISEKGKKKHIRFLAKLAAFTPESSGDMKELGSFGKAKVTLTVVTRNPDDTMIYLKAKTKDTWKCACDASFTAPASGRKPPIVVADVPRSGRSAGGFTSGMLTVVFDKWPTGDVLIGANS